MKTAITVLIAFCLTLLLFGKSQAASVKFDPPPGTFFVLMDDGLILCIPDQQPTLYRCGYAPKNTFQYYTRDGIEKRQQLEPAVISQN